MKTVNSLSGGKTSSYLAVHYPADLNVFALVCVDCHNVGKKIDPGIKRIVNDRLQKYSSHWPEFRATTEDPKVLKVILDLEQMIGQEIIWLRGMGWEEMMRKKRAVPNIKKRFCTTIMKIEPIFQFLYMYYSLPVKMRLGYRYDEMERMERASTIFKYPTHCQLTGRKPGIHRWEEIEWRINEAPMIEDKIVHYHVKRFWEDWDIDFPPDSNCQNCFWKADQQLRRNFDENEEIMLWAAVQEEVMGHTFRKRPLLSIQKDGIQQDFAFGGGAGCQAGFCTS
ncbi:MAG: hypothetical protein AAFW00_19725 [Bacteroidota bacterium]